MVVFAVAGGPQRVRWKYIFTWSGQCHIVGESTEFCSTYFILRDEVCLPTLCVHMNAGSSHLTCDRWTKNPSKYEQNFSRRWEHRPWQRAILVSPLQCILRRGMIRWVAWWCAINGAQPFFIHSLSIVSRSTPSFIHSLSIVSRSTPFFIHSSSMFSGQPHSSFILYRLFPGT